MQFFFDFTCCCLYTYLFFISKWPSIRPVYFIIFVFLKLMLICFVLNIIWIVLWLFLLPRYYFIFCIDRNTNMLLAIQLNAIWLMYRSNCYCCHNARAWHNLFKWIRLLYGRALINLFSMFIIELLLLYSVDSSAPTVAEAELTLTTETVTTISAVTVECFVSTPF